MRSTPLPHAEPPPPAPRPNPFSRPVIDGPRDVLVTAESIHRAELERIVAVFEQLVAQPLPRLQPGPLAMLVLSQMPGSGKSHLLGRLWRVLNGRATVIFLRAHQDQHAFWRRILERLVQELEHPEANDQRVLQPGAGTQLDSLARHLLADLMQRAIAQGHWKARPEVVAVVRQGRADALAQMRDKLQGLMVWLDKLVPVWVGQLAAAGLKLERNAVAWLKVLVSYTLHTPGEVQRNLALAWLQGNELEPQEAQLLGLTASQCRPEPAGKGSEASLNESAFQCVKDLCSLSAFFRPVVFAFDQTEVYGQSPQLAHAFGATLGRLQAECVNQLTVVTANEQPWRHSVSKHFEQADLDRFDPQQQVVLKGIDHAQAVELLSVKLQQAGYPADEIARFVAAPWLGALFAHRASRPLPRAIEHAASQALAQPQPAPAAADHTPSHRDTPDTPAPVAPLAPTATPTDPLAQAFEQHRQRLLATPKALDFDLGVLLWTLGRGVAQVPGLAVTDLSQQPKSRLQLRWQSGPPSGQAGGPHTLYLVLDTSTHWKHWQGVVGQYQQVAQQQTQALTQGANPGQATRVTGRVLWHHSLKAVGEGMRKQIEAAAPQGLALLDLSDSHMADLYAAQALYADVCQGDLPQVDQPTLLAFLGQRLQALVGQWLAAEPHTAAASASGATASASPPPSSSPAPAPSPAPSPALNPAAPAAPTGSPAVPATAPPAVSPAAAPAAPAAVSPQGSPGVQLGRQRQHPQPPLHLPLATLARHSAVLGSTGSGKTTAALHLLEQAMAQGVPVVLLDRKGDLCRYAQPEAWQDPSWPPGEHFNPAARAALRQRLAISVYTPGSLQGRGLRLPLAPAGLAQLPAEERDQAAQESASAFSAALGLTRLSDKPKQAVLVRVFQVLARRLEDRGLVLDDVLALLTGDDPDLMDAIGVLDRKLCTKLAEQVQTFKINSGTLMDERAERLDWARWLQARADGRVPLTIVSTKFLGDDGNALFWVAQFFLELLRHISRHPSDQLQGLLMIDEADLYLPAVRVPATKGPLASLLRRARSGGIGLMLCTQSPGDLDYTGRDNIRNWLLGSIREARALDKLSGLLAESRVAPELLGKQKIGQFVFAAEGLVTALTVPPNQVKTQQLSEPEILQVAAQAARLDSGPA